MQKSGDTPSEHVPASHLEHGQVQHGPTWIAIRNLNRLAEAWYRQFISLSYQIRGYVVVYDRHFLFDAAPDVVNYQVQSQEWPDRLYYWILSHLYPMPDLVIFLDAPADVLYEQKEEATLEHLNRRRGAFFEQGKKLDNFVRVDTTQPLDNVFEEVIQHILEFHASRDR